MRSEITASLWDRLRQGLGRGHASTTPAAAQGATSETALFRTEALAFQFQRYGAPVGRYPVSWTVISGVLAVLALSALVFVCTASFNRRETARGVLRPVTGDLKIYAPAGAIVRDVLVIEDQAVKAGQKLLLVSNARTPEGADAINQETQSGLAAQETSLRERLNATLSMGPLEQQELASQAASLVAAQTATDKDLAVSRARLALAQDRLAAGRALLSSGYIIKEEIRRREDAVLGAEAAVSSANARLTSGQADLAALKSRQKRAALAAAKEASQLREQLGQLNQQRAQYEQQKDFYVRAPASGRISALQTVAGGVARGDTPLLTVYPADANLRAEIFMPARASGDLKTGQRVRLMYDAFPYQHFGVAYGTITNVSASVLAPTDIQAPIQLEEPTYRVLVRLDSATIKAFGRNAPLRAGMALTADVLLEKRTVAQWLLRPLLAMKGRT